MEKVRIGMIGTGFSGNLHADALTRDLRAEIVACAGTNQQRAEAFAANWKIPKAFDNYRRLLEIPEIDLITIGAPNYLHCQMTVDAAQAGKHVIVEKPLCMTLDEADRMIAACRDAKVRLMYAEDLCFAPKYVRAKQLVDEGALGRLFRTRQLEKHFGPHTEWFWDVERSGGGALFDMGCHGAEFARWMLDKPKVKSVYAHMGTYVHSDKTRGEDDATGIIEWENGAVSVIENSWAKQGGIEDFAELHGTEGVIYCDLVRGSSMLAYSEKGFGYAIEKASTTQGWTFPLFDEWMQYGYPAEMQHFLDCMIDGKEPLETGEDGKAILEIMFACYESAAAARRIDFPYTPSHPSKPIEAWLRRSK